MNPTFQSKIPSAQGSKILAMIFLVIAIMGIISTIQRPLRNRDVNITTSLTDTISTQIQRSLPHQNYSTPSLWGYVIRTILVFVLLVLILYWGLKFYRRRVPGELRGASNIKITGKFYLSPKQYIVSAVWNDKEYLLGVTENQISKIAEIDLSQKDEQENDEFDAQKDFNE